MVLLYRVASPRSWKGLRQCNTTLSKEKSPLEKNSRGVDVRNVIKCLNMPHSSGEIYTKNERSTHSVCPEMLITQPILEIKG